ncbi:MAG TPA: coproporphyrinogen III oxidase, partial [Pseudomonas sp.]|nr:coproporphyrinogen III oxidase [Pseudomonas sp.]HBB22258.1 coproporphyrinogen III oxidase [Pseudomonas sp.]
MLGSVTWDEALVQRYGQFGQLHCSYPAAVDFSDRVAPLDLLRALRESRRGGRPLSLSI